MNAVNRARASPYYLLHSQSAQQFINCCIDYEFTNCAARFIAQIHKMRLTVVYSNNYDRSMLLHSKL